MQGADSEQLEQLAARLEAGADELERVLATTRSALHTLGWHGADGEVFRQDWEGAHQRRLSGAATHLRDAASTLRRNSAQQREASSADGSISAPGGANWFTSAGGGTVRLLASAAWVGSAVGVLVGEQTLHVDGPHSGVKNESFGESKLTTSRLFVGARATTMGGSTVGPVTTAYDAGVAAGAEIHGATHGSVGSDGISGDASIGGSVGIVAAAAASAGLAGVGSVDGTAHAWEGARTDAEVRGGIGPDGAQLKAEGGGFVGVEAGGEVSAHALGATATAGGEVYAGIGAHARVNTQLTLQQVHIGVDAGAALGIGAGLKFDLSINPQESAQTVLAKFGFPY